MPDTVALVTDTHPLIFHAAGEKRLGKRASAHFQACERQERIIYVPSAVVWEVGLLMRARRIDLKRSLRKFFDDLFSNPAFQALDLTSDQVFLADEIALRHDPFDALICAAALSLDLPLITRDGNIEDSGVVRVVW